MFWKLLVLVTAAGCWMATGLRHAPSPRQGTFDTKGNPLAFRGSAYGSLIARVMKDSLNGYWHDGKREKEGEHDHDKEALAGRLRALQHHHPAEEEEHADHHSDAWVDRCVEELRELEEHRFERTSPFATSPSHKRYLDAAADWRLRLAHDLDPSDAALYEILHYTLMAHAPSVEVARDAAEKLARHTIERALDPQSGPSDALTGAGAAINLLNEQLQPDRNVPPVPARLTHDWQALDRCLKRYHHLREQAEADGSWDDIPPVRRQEIQSYATMLERIATQIGRQLASKGLVQSGQSSHQALRDVSKL